MFEYILNDMGEPVKATMEETMTWFSKNKERRSIAKTSIKGVRISTVFLVLDHNHGGDGKPILWETMVFEHSVKEFPRENKELADLQWRYRDRAVAVAHHEEITEHLSKGTLQKYCDNNHELFIVTADDLGEPL